MEKSRLAAILDEIEQCKKLYPESSQDQEIVKLLFQTRSKFEQDNDCSKSDWKQDLTQAQADEIFKNNKTIISEVKLSKEIFWRFFELTCDSISNLQPALETPLKDLCACVREELESYKDTVDAEKICQIMNKSFEKINVKNDFATFVFSFVLSSVYQWHMDDSLKKVNTKLWTHSNCPICGKSPHYGMLREKDGAKVMECWQCGTQWIYSRLKCPFCETTDHRKLGYFTAGSDAICRVYFCRECNKYHKVFDFREREGAQVFLTVHHLASLSHDILAENEGYKPGSCLHWVNDEELITTNTGGEE